MSVAEQVHAFGTIIAQKGKEDELRGILKELVAQTKTESGVLQYILHEDPANIGSFYVFESYKNAEAVNVHATSPHLAAALAKGGHLVAGAPSIIQLKVVAGA